MNCESRDLTECIDTIISDIKELRPEYGKHIVVDSSDIEAYANGQPYLYKGGPPREKFSDPDASVGHRSAIGTRASGSFYG